MWANSFLCDGLAKLGGDSPKLSKIGRPVTQIAGRILGNSRRIRMHTLTANTGNLCLDRFLHSCIKTRELRIDDNVDS